MGRGHLTKLGGIACLLSLTASVGHRVVAQAPAAPASERRAFGDAWFEGTVGNATVRVYVEDAGWPKEDGLWGVYYYTMHWSPLPLEGHGYLDVGRWKSPRPCQMAPHSEATAIQRRDSTGPPIRRSALAIDAELSGGVEA